MNRYRQLALNRIAAQRKKRSQEKKIKQLKERLKKEPSFLEKCKEYRCNPNFIDDVNVSFEELDVSAKTVNGEIFLNEKLFDEGDWHDQMRYVVHEMTHVMQQASGMVSSKKTDNEDYLDDDNEQEAFKAQLEYMDDHRPEEIQEYLEQLLDHHNLEGKERRRKLKELTEDLGD
jgi:hypothetical protein